MATSPIMERLHGEPWVAVPSRLLAEPRLSPQAKVVWAALHAHIKPGGHGIYPKRTTIARECGGCSVATVKRAVAELKAAGWLEVRQRRNKHGNLGVNDYTLCIPRVTDDPRSEVTPDRRSRVTADSPEVEEVGSRNVRPNGRNRAAVVAAAGDGSIDDFLDDIADIF